MKEGRKEWKEGLTTPQHENRSDIGCQNKVDKEGRKEGMNGMEGRNV